MELMAGGRDATPDLPQPRPLSVLPRPVSEMCPMQCDTCLLPGGKRLDSIRDSQREHRNTTETASVFRENIARQGQSAVYKLPSPSDTAGEQGLDIPYLVGQLSLNGA